MKNSVLIKYLFFITLTGLLPFLLIVFSFDNNAILLILPILITLTFSLPFFIDKSIDIFSVWSFVFYSVLFGVLLRSFYIFYEIPNHLRINEVFLLSQKKEFLIPAMFLILSGSIFIVFGYSITKKRLSIKSKIFSSNNWHEKRFFSSTITLVIISLISLISFVNYNGGLFSIQSLSSYRGISNNLTDLSSLSYLRALISLSGINSMILLSWLLKEKKKKFRTVFLLIISLSTFVFYNFYVSQRAAVFFIFVNFIALTYYLNKSSISSRKIILWLVPALLLFQIMSTLRQGFVSIENQKISFNLLKTLEPAILTTNMIDVSKTAHIIESVPEKINFQYGYTFMTWTFAWIPRSLWRNKPVTNVDNTIGAELYGSRTFGSGGVPPGIFGELYWNFWIPGVLIGCFLLGKYLKIVHLSFSRNKSNINVIIIFVTVFMLNGVWLIGSSFTSVLIGMLTSVFPLILLLNYITKK